MKYIKKKPVIYASIFVGQIIVTLLISYFTGVETSNTWLGVLYANAFCLTVVIMLVDITKKVRNSYPLLGCITRFSYILMIVIFGIINIVLLVGVFR